MKRGGFCVRIANLLMDNDLNNEERKRSINQRKANETYKKNATYVQASQKPAFEVLERLLSEKEVHKKNSPTSESEKKEDSGTSTHWRIESTPLFEQGKKTYFPPPIPFHQHIQSTNTQIQQTTNELTSEHKLDEKVEEPPISHQPIDVVVPERFQKELHRKLDEEVLFGKNLERTLVERAFQKAKKSYAYQMQMAQEGFTIQQSNYLFTA